MTPKKYKPYIKKEVKSETTPKYSRMNPYVSTFAPFTTPTTNKVENRRNMNMLKMLLPAFQELNATQKFQALHQFSVILNGYINPHDASVSETPDSFSKRKKN